MLLIPKLERGILYLDAYSFKDNELSTVATVLRRAGVPFTLIELRSDSRGRRGLRHTVTAENVPKLQEHLGVQFRILKRGFFHNPTVTEFPGGGSSYRCEEIVLGGMGNGCETILATGDVEATVKCALVANNHRWFGSVASPGRCR